jgi:hypothetical protein|tara:strand:- start:264 stop:1004 length:741 start_codon:yes stop_codon:yes gene_type:complete
MRAVILHYHLFKNAGTSLDAAFKDNFSEDEGEWVTKEFSNQPALNQKQVIQWIFDSPKAKCFSSHTMMFPTPKIDGIRIIPVIFFRNPIDRIASAYAFEKKQNVDSFGSVLARYTSLGGYIETRLALPHDRQCRNFHAHRLEAMFDPKHDDEFTRAKMAIEQLPFIGLVERYSESLEKLESLLEREGFEGIKLKPVERNVSRGEKKSLDEKIADIRDQVGKRVFSKLIESNKLDLALFEALDKDKQ